MMKKTVFQHDETDLDGQLEPAFESASCMLIITGPIGHPNLNLASFVHTWMPPQADKVIIPSSRNVSLLIGTLVTLSSWLKSEWITTNLGRLR